MKNKLKSDLIGYFFVIVCVLYIFICFGDMFLDETKYLVNGETKELKVQNITKSKNKYIYFFQNIDGDVYKSIDTKKKIKVNELTKIRILKGSNKVIFGRFQIMPYLILVAFLLFGILSSILFIKKSRLFFIVRKWEKDTKEIP